MALLSGAPFDDPTWWLLGNDQIVAARDMVNDFAGTTRLLGHSVITPGQDGWMDEVRVEPRPHLSSVMKIAEAFPPEKEGATRRDFRSVIRNEDGATSQTNST